MRFELHAIGVRQPAFQEGDDVVLIRTAVATCLACLGQKIGLLGLAHDVPRD
jgi:hypothetical protein